MLDTSELSIINRRVLKWVPPHFHTFDLKEGERVLWTHGEDIKRWIDYKLTGRYCIVNKPNRQGLNVTIGFEDPKELTYFMLACPFKQH